MCDEKKTLVVALVCNEFLMFRVLHGDLRKYNDARLFQRKEFNLPLKEGHVKSQIFEICNLDEYTNNPLDLESQKIDYVIQVRIK